ncbi:mitochondrial 37S ribosomal protein bS6m [Nakaseomyces bracarensis]|uniref:mitochondrial 37S ribosomal protein bS6m n=1 Tax=Nakaseomyces bracarensis TaxID=273131 RepID=UPI003871AD8B
MLYELVAMVRILQPKHNMQQEAKELATTIGRMIIENRGVVRKIMPMGKSMLPRVVTKDQERHFQGYQFMMLFDSSIPVQSQILRTLKKDPRVIRSSIIKVNMDKELTALSSLEKSQGL